MNNARKKAIDKIVSGLEGLQAQLASIKGEEESAHDNTNENFETYYDQEEWIEAMENADGSLQEAIDYLTEKL